MADAHKANAMEDEIEKDAILEIRRNADGEIRRDPKIWKYHGDFIWAEGNFACDCNRYLFWCRAADEPETEDEDAPEHRCGEDRYSIRLTDLNGNILYEDFDEVPDHPQN